MNQELAIRKNLEDAGCPPYMIECFMMKWQGGEVKDGFKLLEMHRCALLDALHQQQKRIDYLDYLIYQLQKSEKEP